MANNVKSEIKNTGFADIPCDETIHRDDNHIFHLCKWNIKDASGTSMEKYGAYTDSFEGKLEGLESTFESLSNTVVNSDFLKGTIDTGTQALEIFDKVTNSLGVINTAAIGLGIFQGKNNSGESTWDSPHAFFKTTYAA